jgi:zinc/manganese transport system permease protein
MTLAAGGWGDLMVAPLVMCLVLTGIHGYLGIHVLSRKVIFVDLALAQIAALGTTVAYVLGYDAAHDPADASRIYWFSLCFTLIGAGVFAVTRMRKERVPQEAFIGIVYASASAVAILVLAKSPGEGEHIKQMLVGNILLVSWPAIAKTALIYGAIGLFHFIFRRRFFQISLDPEAAEREGVAVRWWDFLFYASFGIVITSSVAIAGVLLVFTYLVVPAACAVLLAEGVRARILIAWALGAAASAGGIQLSYGADLPTGPAVVATFAGLLAGLGLAVYVIRSPSPLRAIGRVLTVALVASALAGGLYGLRKREIPGHEHPHDFQFYMRLLAEPDENRRIEAIHHLMETGDPHAVDRFIELTRTTPSESPVLEHLMGALGKSRDLRAVEPLLEIARRPDLDPALGVEAGAAVLALRDPRGLGVLVSILADPEAPPFAREKARRRLQEATGLDLGSGPDGRPVADREAAAGWEAWWKENEAWVRWRENLKKFQ